MGEARNDVARLALAAVTFLLGCGARTEAVDAPPDRTPTTSSTRDAPPQSTTTSSAAPPSAPPGCADPLPASPPEVSPTGDAEPWASAPELATGLIDIAVVADGTTRTDDQLPWQFLREGEDVHAVESVDLDGDGRSEVMVTGSDQHGSIVDGWIVPGDTPAGTHDPGDVGISTSEAIRDGGRVEIMDDLDGDGTREVLVLPSRTAVVVDSDGWASQEVEDLYLAPTRGYSASEVMALEPPASLSDVQPYLEVPGLLNWTLDVGGDTPGLLSGQVHGPDGTAATLYLRHEGVEVRLSTAPIPFTASYVNDFGILQARRTDASVLLRLLQSSRGFSSALQWEVPLECLVR
jgi:hypothetical protein